MKRSLLLLMVICMLAASCTGGDTTDTTAPVTTTTSTTTTTVPGTTTPTTSPPTDLTALLASLPRPGAMPAFADFPEIPLLGDAPPYAGPPTPGSLADVLIAPALAGELADPELRTALAANGFAVAPAWPVLFYQAYELVDYDPYPVFVTTDTAYHVWHLAFSKVLREVEQQRMLPILEELTLGLLAAAGDQRAELAGTPLEETAVRVEEWFQAAATLLGLDAGPLGERPAAEVELAKEAVELTTSPVTSFAECRPGASAANCVDYSLFKPRGHYTRNDELERYFRAMSLYGQTGFFADQPDSLRIGALVARLLASEPELAARWQEIYEPTAFLVGLADDYTPFELAAVVEQASPGALADPLPLAEDATLDEIGRRLFATREVRINVEAAAVRVMGARFVIDSFVLDQLAWPYVGEPPLELRRVRVSPLDLAAVFGSEFAYRLQDEAGETAYRNYDAQLEAMKAELAARTTTDWAATVYDAWLYALAPMWEPKGAAHPDFMQTEAWTAKAHQTGFGSYTELKHDTILYAKQGFAAEAGVEPPEFEPRHWVEPDPVAFGRLAAVVALARDGLATRGLLPEDLDELIDNVYSFITELERLAADELAGRPISEEDNLWLQATGPWLELLWLQSADLDPDTPLPAPADAEAALVADIFRSTFDVLELGTGRIDFIYVLVPNDEGIPQVARGGVYSYYEFWRPAAQGRLTDEEWRQLLDSGDVPARPVWQAAFLVGADALTAVAPDAGGGPVGLPAGLFCRDLAEEGYGYADAYAYWEAEGRPDRMDADRNGVPCETVYPAEEVAAFLDAQG